MQEERASKKVIKAAERFRDKVYKHADEIDPNDRYDWHDMAIGFMIASGLTILEADEAYEYLCEMGWI